MTTTFAASTSDLGLINMCSAVDLQSQLHQTVPGQRCAKTLVVLAVVFCDWLSGSFSVIYIFFKKSRNGRKRSAPPALRFNSHNSYSKARWIPRTNQGRNALIVQKQAERGS